MNTVGASLYDYLSGRYVRPATVGEEAASIDAARHDGGAGVIRTDDVARAFVV